MKNLVDFTGKHILVVGGSSGIGRQTAITLSRLGARVDVAARREDKLAETVAMLEGEGHVFFKLDVSDLDSIGEAIAAAVTENGAYDGLVYCAGLGWSIPLSSFTPKMMQKLADVNVFGFVETARQISRRGRFSPGMHIVGISSVESIRGAAGHTGYSMTKAAMDGAVRAMAIELAKKGICINTVAPGMTNTQMFEDYKEAYGTDNIHYEMLIRRQNGQIGDPQDIANAVAFLLSPSARIITGTCVPVDGGYRA